MHVPDNVIHHPTRRELLRWGLAVPFADAALAADRAWATPSERPRRISLWMDHGFIRKHWIPNLRLKRPAFSPALRQECEVLVTMGTFAGTGMPGAIEAMSGLRSLGVSCVPACATLKKHYGHDYESWFDKNLWKEVALVVARLAEHRADSDPRMAIDLEPYIGEVPKRYPERGEPGGNDYRDEYRLIEAMAPLVKALRALGVEPMVLPGGLEYAASSVLINQLTGAIVLDEYTYRCPLDDAFWAHFDRRKPAFDALGREYLPGFYAQALRSKRFQTTLKTKTIDTYWCFFRKEDDPERFWLPEWFSRTQT